MTSMTGTKPSFDGNSNKMTWQMEVLMEKLRSKACSLRSMPDSAKLIKQSILNKQHILDPGEKQALGQCLDKLQQNIQVSTLPAMVERLEATAKQLGLTFTAGTSGPEVYISCDMFYVEVHLQNEGKARDVKVELAGDQNEQKGQSSPELVDCLNRGNFSDFMAHLEGFLSIYQLNTEKKYKCKAYQALQALETDLMKLFEMAQETLGDTHRLIFKSPVGLLMKRKGGHPVKIIYFNSPFELLDVDSQRSVSLTYETASTREFSHSVSVAIEASTSHKLQTMTLVNIKEGTDGLNLPSISGLTSVNSISLPAYFTLRLKKPMAMSIALAKKISDVTGISCYEPAGKEPLLPLILKQAEAQVDSKGLFVTLPDQHHCYFMSSAESFDGVLVSRVPFAHPTSVAHILEFLRAQAVFNSLITSCIRPKSKQGMESTFIFEVTAVTHEHISITFEHPQEESTATAELDLSDFSNVKCRLHTLSKDTPLCSDEYATKVLQRCLSIPITMRAVMRKMIREEKEAAPAQGDSVVKMEGAPVPDPNQNTKFLLTDYNSVTARRDPVVPVISNNNNIAVNKAPITAPPHKQNPFLGDGKLAKVRKRKEAEESPEAVVDRREIKVVKRRSSADNLSDAGNCDLAALREKVYGAGSAANFAKFNLAPSKDVTSKDSSKKLIKKPKAEAPIVLDLTEAPKKAGVSLSAALLKRPGIEIIPISGSSSPIAIPSSITVTPVIKSSSSPSGDEKRRERQRKEKKRRREDSPKPSKVQIITAPLKESPLKKSPFSPSTSPSFSPSHKPTVYSPTSKGASSPKPSNLSPKSHGKPSMKAPPTFSLSPKGPKGPKEKSPSLPSSNASSAMKKTEKAKASFSDALTITKVAVSDGGSTPVTVMDRGALDKAKASPPKNRKGSSLSDIVDKLRAGAGASEDGKKEGDQNFTIKQATGLLKFTINKSKSPPTKSGLKPGVMSGPASKKTLPTIPKLPSLPPIPKLPPAAVANVTSTSISPLSNSLASHTSPLSYSRSERPPKPLPKAPEVKKSPLKKPPATDALDKALKDMFGDDDSPPKSTDSSAKAESDTKETPLASVMAPPIVLKEEPQKENVPVSPQPPSPVVAIKIVKSPVASPLNLISPQSVASPCIIDDELMDEALMGSRK